MWALAIALLFAAGPARAAPQRPALPTAVHLVGSPELLASDATSRILGVLYEELELGTRLELTPATELGIENHQLDRCNELGLLSCWVLASRPASMRDVEFILTLALRRAQSGGVQVALLLVRTSDELVAIARRARSQDEEVEDRIFRGSFAIDRELSPDDAEGARVLARELRARLRAQDRSHDVGTFLIRGGAPGLWVRLDGETLGALDGAGAIDLARIVPGSHDVDLIDPRGERLHSTEVVVVRTATTSVLIPTLTEPLAPLVQLYGGLGLAAAGAGILVYSVVAPSNHVFCEPSNCGRSFTTFGEGHGTGSGVMIAPLGYSLVLVGAAWATSPLLLPNTEAMPWLGLGLSVLLGAASYGLSAAVGG